MSEAEIRSRIVSIARSCIGAHYLKGTYGQKPPLANDDTTERIRGASPSRTVEFITVRNFRELAVRAAMIHPYPSGAKRCCGRFLEHTGKHDAQVQFPQRAPARRAHSRYAAFYRWFDYQVSLPDTQRTDPFLDPAICARPMFPRRQHTSGDATTVLGNYVPDRDYVYYGEDCHGRQHFDCAGFLSYVLTKAGPGQRIGPRGVETSNMRTAWVRDLGSLSSAGHASCQPGDIFMSSTHCAIVVSVSSSTIRLVHPYGEQWGVKETVFNPQEWDNNFMVINLGEAYLGS